MKNNPNYLDNTQPYKSKYMCTACRKIFKRKLLSDISNGPNLEETEPKCPECGLPTTWIGPKFRAPKTDNLKAWNSIKTLQEIGVLNFVGWATNFIEIPESKKLLDIFLTELKSEYTCQIKNLISAEYGSENKNQIKYFSEMILKIEKQLEK